MIIDDLAKIKIEIMQDEWDKILILKWRSYPTHKVGFELHKFMDKYHVSFDFLVNLKRVPRYANHYYCRFSRYIAAYLPELNSALFNKKNSDEQILKFMKKFDTLRSPVDSNKSKKERSELKLTHSEFLAELLTHNSRIAQREYTAKGNWHHVK